MRILLVRYEDGSEEKFGVPDEWEIPPLWDAQEWLRLPNLEGSDASIVLRLHAVTWMSAHDEQPPNTTGALLAARRELNSQH